MIPGGQNTEQSIYICHLLTSISFSAHHFQACLRNHNLHISNDAAQLNKYKENYCEKS